MSSVNSSTYSFLYVTSTGYSSNVANVNSLAQLTLIYVA